LPKRGTVFNPLLAKEGSGEIYLYPLLEKEGPREIYLYPPLSKRGAGGDLSLNTSFVTQKPINKKFDN